MTGTTSSTLLCYLIAKCDGGHGADNNKGGNTDRPPAIFTFPKRISYPPWYLPTKRFDTTITCGLLLLPYSRQSEHTHTLLACMAYVNTTSKQLTPRKTGANFHFIYSDATTNDRAGPNDHRTAGLVSKAVFCIPSI
jgi:hypothetical protein